jgi:glucoamylase
MQNKKSAAPGIKARWTSSSKSGLGRAINAASKIAFMLSHGILNKVYYPHEEMARIRDMGWIVIDGKDFISEIQRHARHQTKTNNNDF